MAQPDRRRVVGALRRAAHTLADRRTVRDPHVVLHDLVHSAAAAVPRVGGVGISRTDGGVVRSSHVTAGFIHDLDRMQSDVGEGPCIATAGTPVAAVVSAPDLAGDDRARWPRFADEALRAGWRSVVSVRLSPNGERHASLTLYANEPTVLDAAAELVAGLFAVQAAAVLHGAERAAHLGHALEIRDVVGQAKGILMERYVVDDDEAFQVLARSCRDTDLDLVGLARWLTSDAVERRERNRRGHPRTASVPRPSDVD